MGKRDRRWDGGTPLSFGEGDDVMLQASPISVEPKEVVDHSKCCGDAAVIIALPGVSCCSSPCTQKGGSSVLGGKASISVRETGFSADTGACVCIFHSPRG